MAGIGANKHLWSTTGHHFFFRSVIDTRFASSSVHLPVPHSTVIDSDGAVDLGQLASSQRWAQAEYETE